MTGLTKEELFKFKMWFYQWEPGISLPQVMDGDILDFVDRILEILGKKNYLQYILNSVNGTNKAKKFRELNSDCWDGGCDVNTKKSRI